jgi:hypothetical protein
LKAAALEEYLLMRIITAFLLLFCISQYSQGDMALEHAKNNYEKN